MYRERLRLVAPITERRSCASALWPSQKSFKGKNMNKVKEQKKEYVTPAMKIAKLRRQVALLQDSDPPGWGGYGN